MKNHIARAITSILKSQFKVNVQKGKSAEPCTRVWTLKLFAKHLTAVYEHLIQEYSVVWNDEEIWKGNSYLKCVYAHYFAIACEDGKEEDVVAEAKINGAFTRLFGKVNIFRGSDKHKSIEKLQGPDKFEGKPDLCSEIVFCNQTDAKLSTFPLGELGKHSLSDRITILKAIRNLEITALMVKQTYGVQESKLVSILCFQKNRIAAVCANQLANWMLSLEAQTLFPVLHIIALQKRFIVLHAFETEQYDL